jgi:outer membrane receptor protein involved in Fe transport
MHVRSKKGKIGLRRAATGLLATTMLCASGAALAQDRPAPTAPQPASAASDDEDTIYVTATRREENLQDVPIAITALGTQTLEDLQVDDFDDYARFVPSLSFRSLGPGFANVYFRGVASGENANHSASLPSVGTYLDEQPITTTTGALDLHIFDIARVEALAGPQGTLYGASSQAGTVRIITNPPDTSDLYGEVNLEVNSVAHGEIGYTAEGFINAPLSSNVALRIVGWYRRDAGYIDNIPGTIVFPINQVDDEGNLVDLPGDDIVFTNDEFVEEDYNDVDTYGARAALRIELNDNWTVTPQVMGQRQLSRGSFAQESGLPPLSVQQFNDERADDRWYQAALTVQGRIGNFDMTYAGAWMQRQIDSELDYVDYAYFYDVLAGYARYFYDNDDNQVNPNQYIVADDSFTRMTHELRFTSPADRPVRLVAGAFYQRQTHNIEQNYIIDNIADAITVPGTESNIWLTKQLRVDRDYAIFGELAWDITPQLTLTGGGRLYRYDNSLVGFFGYSNGYSGSTGVAACFTTEGPPLRENEDGTLAPPIVDGSPCTNVDKSTADTGFIHRLNLTYRISEDALIYGTWSRGFRPGGINRRGTLPPYGADFINNYELGLKTSWLDNRLIFNAAIYQLGWDNIQLSFLGENGLTEIRNAGNARIRGAEFDIIARPATGLTMSLGAAFNDAELTEDFCLIANDEFDCSLDIDLDGDGVPEENDLLAPSGTRLPLTARFKGNARIRYEFPVGPGTEAHVQLSASHEGRRTRDLRTLERQLYGDLVATTTVDFSIGVERGPWRAELFARNLFDERGALGSYINCLETTCGDPDGITDRGGIVYTIVNRPRMIGIRVGRRL